MWSSGAPPPYTPPRAGSRPGASIDYYRKNAQVIREGLTSAGLQVFGGVNAPYIWLKTSGGMGSWDFFDLLLDQANVATTPAPGFGPSGGGLRPPHRLWRRRRHSGSRGAGEGRCPQVIHSPCQGHGEFFPARRERSLWSGRGRLPPFIPLMKAKRDKFNILRWVVS